MPGWLKALLIVAVLVVLLVVGVIVGGVVWWSRNKDTLIGRAKEVATEGKDFGRNSDNQGCVDESLSRYKKEPGFASATSTTIFVDHCLNASRPTPGFCTDVPKLTEFVKSKQWSVAQCSRVGLASDNYCQALFRPVQEFCERGPRKSSEDSKANSY